MRAGAVSWILFSLLVSNLGRAAELPTAAVLENAVLRITLAPEDASVTVLDKRNGYSWRQLVRPGYRVDPAGLRNTPGSILANILGPGQSYQVTLSLDAAVAQSFDLVCQISGRSYTMLPNYPFPFTASGKDWSYVRTRAVKEYSYRWTSRRRFTSLSVGVAASPGGD